MRPGSTNKSLNKSLYLPLSKIILILYHLLPYNIYNAYDASNGQSGNNHDTVHWSTGDKNASDSPSGNHGRCNDCNIDPILSDDNRNEFYHAIIYNLVICKKINPDQILNGDEDNDSPNVLYNRDNNNYDHDTYQCMTYNKDNDTPQQCSLPRPWSLISCSQWQLWQQL